MRNLPLTPLKVVKASNLTNRAIMAGGQSPVKVVTKVNDLPLFGKQIGWRSNSTRMDSPKGASAADVVKYECDELGNEGEYTFVTPEILKELENYDPLWVTRTKAAARHYGEPVPVTIPKDARVIVKDDGDGGSLLAVPRAKSEPFLGHHAVEMPRRART